MDPDVLIHEYLGRIEAGAAELAPARRAELVADLREHIAMGLAEEAPLDETAVRRVLARMGAPEEILAAEGELPILWAAHPESRLAAWWQGLSTETRALGFLTLGAVVLPFVGPLVGLWFVSGSTRWTLAQKRIVMLIVLVLLALPAVLLLPAVVAGELTWVVTSGGFALPLVPSSGLAAAAYLVLSSPTTALARRES